MEQEGASGALAESLKHLTAALDGLFQTGWDVLAVSDALYLLDARVEALLAKDELPAQLAFFRCCGLAALLNCSLLLV